MASDNILGICPLVLVLSAVVLDYSAAFMGVGVREHFLYIVESPGAVFPRILLIAWS